MAHNFSLYRMRRNAYLGDCMVIVIQVNPQFTRKNNLTGNIICLYIKTAKDQSQFSSLKAITENELFDPAKPILLRIASCCELGVFGDSHCDCESQRVACLRTIHNTGQGIFIQLPQEGMGHGLLYKARELELQVSGVTPEGEYVGPKDIYEAAAMLLGGQKIDKRTFAFLRQPMEMLGLTAYPYTMISNNPQKITGLSKVMGLTIIGSMHCGGTIDAENAGVILAKILQNNLSYTTEELEQVYDALAQAQPIPERTLALMRHIQTAMQQNKKFASNQELLAKITSLLPA